MDNEPIFKCITFSDLHLGTDIKESEINFIINTAKKYKDDNTIIVFTGDMFEKRLMHENPQVKLGIRLYTELNKLNIPFISIKGTYSHDFSYFDSFSEIELPNVYFIDKQKEADIILPNGYKISVLFIPEEYLESQEEYYKDTLFNKNKKYDFIFGHGTILGMTRYNLDKEAMPIKNAPLFEKSLLEKKSNLSVFGHIHIFQILNNIMYSGSVSRNSFADEDKKFIHVIEYMKNSEIKIFHIENKFCENYIDCIIDFPANDFRKNKNISEYNIKLTSSILAECTKTLKLGNLCQNIDIKKNTNYRLIVDLKNLSDLDCLNATQFINDTIKREDVLKIIYKNRNMFSNSDSIISEELEEIGISDGGELTENVFKYITGVLKKKISFEKIQKTIKNLEG